MRRRSQPSDKKGCVFNAMTIFSRDFNRNSSYWTAIVFYLVCGLLLLLLPNLALSIANVALALLLCAVGVRSIVSYLRGSVLDGVMGLQLAAGLVALCFALLLLFNPLFLAEVLPFVWGVALLVGGFGKVQMTADLKRIGDQRWWYALVAALVSFVLGALAITRPLFIASVLTQFVGVSLMVEGVLDLVSFLMLNKKIKDFRRTLENNARM